MENNNKPSDDKIEFLYTIKDNYDLEDCGE